MRGRFFDGVVVEALKRVFNRHGKVGALYRGVRTRCIAGRRFGFS